MEKLETVTSETRLIRASLESHFSVTDIDAEIILARLQKNIARQAFHIVI